MKKISIILILIYLLAIFAAFSACTEENMAADTINPKASPNTRLLMGYLNRSYKNVVLSGQYVNTFDDFTKDKFLTDTADKTSWSVFKTDEMTAIHSVTGDYSLILGLEATLLVVGSDQSTVDFAREWHDAGGIVTMCWHWLAPNREGLNNAFYTKDTNFDLAAALADTEGADYQALIADIDTLCEALKPLADADVPILWRPLHEASGGWFWWGASGADSYRALYDILYDRMVNVNGMNNLIWLANAQNPNWYVGDSKCDILSDDPYYLNASKALYELNPVNSGRYTECLRTTENKIIAMSENEFIPDIDAMFNDGVYWSMFATWCRDFVCVMDNGYTTPVYSEAYVTAAGLAAAYANPHVITLNDAPAIYG